MSLKSNIHISPSLFSIRILLWVRGSESFTLVENAGHGVSTSWCSWSVSNATWYKIKYLTDYNLRHPSLNTINCYTSLSVLMLWHIGLSTSIYIPKTLKWKHDKHNQCFSIQLVFCYLKPEYLVGNNTEGASTETTAIDSYEGVPKS